VFLTATLLLIFLLFLFPALDLITDATHLIKAAFGTVTDEDLPSAEEFLFAEADVGVANAATFGVVFGCV
jgi:uncharacterized membrane protein